MTIQPLARLTAYLAIAAALCGCDSTPSSTTPPSDLSVMESEYGKMPDGRPVKIFTLRNGSGTEAKVTEYGAILVSLKTAGRDGEIADVTHGYDTLEGWLGNSSYFGATVGRFGNRIADGKFSIDSTDFELATNNEPGDMPCALHGGLVGFDKVLWQGEVFEAGKDVGVRLRYISADGEEGYPGALEVEIVYTLTDDNELIWEATAMTDAPTIVNVVHHSYWNLSGDPTNSINDHQLTLNADHFLSTNAGLIPTGERTPVVGTPMDFTNGNIIGERIEADYEALKLAEGYDHAWVLNQAKVPGADLTLAARLHDPKSGRTMELSTNQPAVQFYGGNFLDGTTEGKGGVVYQHRTALCLETENFPDAPNHQDFPSAVLRPEETYYHIMVHRFSAE